MELKNKYGQTALIAGASEGLGAAFSRYLADAGFNLVLVARRPGPLQKLAEELAKNHKIETSCIPCDLAANDAAQKIEDALEGRQVDVLVYNAALSFIGPFLDDTEEHTDQIVQVNMFTTSKLVRRLGEKMVTRGRGAVILMASLAGFQGSGYLSMYAATKAFNRVFAESLWYEWKDKGVDVMACCAGATSTPNYLNTKPGKTDFFAPPVQRPEQVVNECFKKLGKKPSHLTGRANRLVSFLMHRVLPRKMAVKIMGDSTRNIYRI
ncbi:MAG: SDR family NAD(P)-dependent oxidoreductase [Prolixibacteraceae bacterium]|nr:SDR family NAD(P)-dependent oxidoreductase [Prolixibacteraceae bacterium]